MLSSVKNIERAVQDRTDKGRELNSAIDACKKLLERWLVLQSGVSIEQAFLRAKCYIQDGREEACFKVTAKIINGMDKFFPSKNLVKRPLKILTLPGGHRNVRPR